MSSESSSLKIWLQDQGYKFIVDSDRLIITKKGNSGAIRIIFAILSVPFLFFALADFYSFFGFIGCLGVAFAVRPKRLEVYSKNSLPPTKFNRFQVFLASNKLEVKEYEVSSYASSEAEGNMDYGMEVYGRTLEGKDQEILSFHSRNKSNLEPGREVVELIENKLNAF